MFELVLAFIVGSSLGVISGIIPGLNVFVSILLVFPLLLTWDPVSIMFMYISLASVHQYFGSVSATVFAIPGSNTSLPALQEGHSMFQNGRGSEAIMTAAIGSFIASMFAIVLIHLSLPMLDIFYQMFNTHIQVFLLSIACITIIIFSGNKIWISFLFWMAGNLLAMVGYHDFYGGWDFATFGINSLYAGIDLLPVMISLFVVPVFAKAWNNSGKIEFDGVTISGYVSAARTMLTKMKSTLARSSVIGALAGFVPGVSWGLSTKLAYITELMLRKRKGIYNEKGDVNCLVAAETSNNAGVYTSMVPMIFAGIPITASTALVYNILLFQGMVPTVAFFQSLYEIVLIGFALSSILGLFIAGKYVNFLKVFSGLNLKVFYSGIFVLLLIICYTTAQKTFAGWDNMVILACLLPFGYLIRRFNTMPLIYGFVLHDIFLEGVYRLQSFY